MGELQKTNRQISNPIYNEYFQCKKNQLIGDTINEEAINGREKMARKINGPFCNVSIQSIGSVGSTLNNNDVFFNLMHSEMAIQQRADEFSSTRLTQMVDRIKKRSRTKKTRPSCRNNTEKCDPSIDLFGPIGFNPTYY